MVHVIFFDTIKVPRLEPRLEPKWQRKDFVLDHPITQATPDQYRTAGTDIGSPNTVPLPPGKE